MIDAPEIRMIPVNGITVLNPRARNKRVFQELVTSIERLGLKKPITVSQRPGRSRYDLVCGQGRLEAFIALGQEQIPAVVIEASEDDCYVMSLVENLARRQHTPLELVRAIGALRERGYSINEIAAKVDFSPEYVSAICYLLENGEEKLISAVERGVIPHTIAMEIARAKDGDVQRALAQAYEEKAIPGNQILAIRQIIEQRNTSGKGIHNRRAVHRNQKPVTADTLIRSLQRETDRRQSFARRASLTRSRLVFVINALKHLLSEERFQLLMRVEGIHTLPSALAARLSQERG
ncbi:MAG: plasmid partitioning protein RepB C-terminal domain-containing protein [Candidatus Omnitrophota bacterium]|jgi:ParB family chromosome partitioning protein|uniref:plasmid partitioning protein RepB C-terminal domain-containing protein n=1 Tax=Brevundimonas mediterranea TaxID=74329 RepID=UPI00275847BF|nr:ParB/RepB/Spo0J family partition protein [Alphaproteobacteria bacterium]MDP3704180.1 plasmid partitioning protein RepB C-terminal domain-containing protein [Candidatus Omnitrophota bacterium]